AVIDGTNYSYMAEGGCFVLAADLLVTGIEDALEVDNTLINQAELLEPGVMVNGVITDAYTITADNIADTEIEDLNISSGTVFVARERGYLARIQFTGTSLLGEGFADFDPSVAADVAYSFDYTPIAGLLEIVPPPGCEAQYQANISLPRMPDAQGFVSTAEGIYYTSLSPLADVLDFYRAEMAVLGYTLDTDSANPPMATLEFSKDGEVISVETFQNGDQVIVTATKK
ncbi:MAG: hypothetical protein N2D54_03695, partial [Chloroflexota bacterium]